VLGDAGGDRRMGELEQQRSRARAEQEEGHPVEAPRLGVGTEQPGDVRGGAGEVRG
jgi:hypothetical protein